MMEILCCECAVPIQANQANMCVNCITARVDITEGIMKQTTVTFCKTCGRYQKPPWVFAELESQQLLAICLKKIKGLQTCGAKLVDAGWVWTEPHSRRLKIKLTIRKEAMHSVILEQSFIVDIVVQTAQCEDCCRDATEHTWKACVQTRQKVAHQRTFLFLEQLLLKHGLAMKPQRVVSMPNGLDFFYGAKSESAQLIDFLQSVVPVRCKHSKRLVSQDFNSNTVNYKFTTYVEIAEICKQDLVCLPPKLTKQLGGGSPLFLVHKISNTIRLVDFCQPSRQYDLDSVSYWKNKFSALCSVSDLVEFVVLDSEEMDEPQRTIVRVRSTKSKRRTKEKKAICRTMSLASMTVAKSSDLGSNDKTYETITHLGKIVKPGDIVLGYDLKSMMGNNDAFDEYAQSGAYIPDIVLVKKMYSTKNRSKRRQFMLKQMGIEEGDNPEKSTLDRDREVFMRDVEEDVEIQELINLYKRHQVDQDDEKDSIDGDMPEIDLDRLLDDLAL